MAKLIKFDNQILNNLMSSITKGMKGKNYAKVYLEVKALQIRSGYVGASRIHYACYAIQLAYSRDE